MNLFTPLQGVLIIAVYAIIMYAVTWLWGRHFSKTKRQFLVADRTIHYRPAAFAIASAWVWAPALFVAAQKAYEQGIVGLFWFTVPNVLCLIVFAYFAKQMRELLPDGFTLSGYIQGRYSNRANKAYLFQLAALAACSTAVQLLAGAQVISAITGLPFFWITILLVCVALGYSILSGIKASIVTDYAQMVWIIVAMAVCVPWVLHRIGDPHLIVKGLGGISGQFGNLFDKNGLMVFWTYGLPMTIGLMSGPFGDQSFWQRAFAVKGKDVTKAFIWGAVIFATVPLILSLLGFIGAGSGHLTDKANLINIQMIMKYLPTPAVVLFIHMLLSGLISTVDSNMCAVSSLMGHDIAQTEDNTKVLTSARWGMILLSIIGVVIANIPGLQIMYLQLFYGTLRSSTLLPTIFSLRFPKAKFSEGGVFWGVILACVCGLPFAAYGNLMKFPPAILAGSLITVSLSGIIMLLCSWWKNLSTHGQERLIEHYNRMPHQP